MRDHLHKTIRKLLRRSVADKTREAQLAGREARRLMERYSVEVTIEQHHVAMPSVTGSYWRERLLVACAKRYDCRAQQHPKTGVTELVGDRDLAEAAQLAYQRAFSHVVIGAHCELPTYLLQRSWSRVAPAEARQPYFEPFPHDPWGYDRWGDRYPVSFLQPPPPPPAPPPPSTPHASEALWFRVYGVAASDTALNLLTERCPIPTATPPVPVARQVAEENAVREQMSSVGDSSLAYELLNMAKARGAARMRAFEWTLRRRPPALPPRPPPSRWNMLEID